MNRLNIQLSGDRVLWILTVALAIVSLLAVYSASSHLAYPRGRSGIAFLVAKHAFFLISGFGVMYIAHRQPFRRFAPLSIMLLPLAIGLLVLTLMQGTTINDANASRWLRFGGITFQTSAMAGLVLMIYIARYLARYHGQKLPFKHSFVRLILPILIVCGLILPANLSTAAILFSSSLALMFIGRYPLKYLLAIIFTGIAFLALFILLVKAFPNISNRVDTWQSRIERFVDGSSEEGYQLQKAHMAIAQGKLLGKGAGKSAQKNFLPQSNSDFIYAIIVEEYGSLGGLFLLVIYLILFFRLLTIATRSTSLFGTLLTVGCGVGIMVQAFVNMGVAVGIFPVTGQTLPLVSAGGSSIWMSCLALGIIQSVSRSYLEAETDQQPAASERDIEDGQDQKGIAHA